MKNLGAYLTLAGLSIACSTDMLGYDINIKNSGIGNVWNKYSTDTKTGKGRSSNKRKKDRSNSKKQKS